MLYTDDFVWMHFGKCAGTTTSSLLRRLFKDIRGDDENTPYQHHSLKQKENLGFTLGARTVISGFRKIENWIPSHIAQQYPDGAPDSFISETLDGKLVLNENSGARKVGIFDGIETLDDLSEMYLDRVDNENIIRAENFQEDFKRVFSRYVPLKNIEIAFLVTEPKNVRNYDKRNFDISPLIKKGWGGYSWHQKQLEIYPTLSDDNYQY